MIDGTASWDCVLLSDRAELRVYLKERLTVEVVDEIGCQGGVRGPRVRWRRGTVDDEILERLFHRSSEFKNDEQRHRSLHGISCGLCGRGSLHLMACFGFGFSRGGTRGADRAQMAISVGASFGRLVAVVANHGGQAAMLVAVCQRALTGGGQLDHYSKGTRRKRGRVCCKTTMNAA